MRVRAVSVAVLVCLVAAGAFYATGASGRQRISTCAPVRVSGGNFNGLPGGVIVAGLDVRNVSHRDCAIATRPWVRVGPISHSVTVADAPPDLFGSPYSAPQRVVTLRPGQRAVTQIYLAPGGCDRGRSVVFALRARAGWGKASVPISNDACKDGSATIWVGSLQR
jgi:hypothetical protein